MVTSVLDLDRYRHVIWDWNGTLLDDVDAARLVVDAMLRRRGLPGLSRERYHELFDFPITEYYRNAGFDFERDPFPQLADEFHEGYDAAGGDMALHSGAPRALELVRARGAEQSVLSAAHQPRLEAQVELFGVRDQFVGLVGIDDHHAGSKVEHGRRWLATLGLPPAAFVMIGDTMHDHQVANELGIDCLLIADGHQPRWRLEECDVRVVDSLADLFSD